MLEDEEDKIIEEKVIKLLIGTSCKDNVMGQDVFEVIHDETKQVLLVTIEDIEEDETYEQF